MKALVTGACGFVGSYLAPLLVDEGFDVLGTTFTDSKNYPFESVLLDVADKEQCRAVILDFEPDIVFHLAGISFVPAAQKDFDNAVRVNVTGVYHVLNSILEIKKRTTFVLASSGEVYGKISPAELPITEQNLVKPSNAYSLTKQMAEDVVLHFSNRYDLPYFIMRPFNHIGPGQNEAFVTATFASQIAQAAHGKSDGIIRVGNLEAKRDFMDVRDAVNAYLATATSDKTGIYNLCSGNACSIQYILDTLIDISGVSVTIEQDHERMRPSEVPIIEGSSKKAYDAFGWKAERGMQTSLEDVYKYWFDVHAA